MGMWRCQNPKCSTDPHGRLIFDFEADRPVCPKCKADGTIPGRPGLIVKLEVIHYDPPCDEVRGGMRRGLNEWACKPGVQWKNGRATGDAIAVTCATCKQTAIWLAGMEAMGEGAVPAEADFEVVIDPERQVIRLANEEVAEEAPPSKTPKTSGQDRHGCCG